MTLQLRLLCAAALCLLLPGCRLEQESLPTKAEPPASKAIEAAKGEPGAVKGAAKGGAVNGTGPGGAVKGAAKGGALKDSGPGEAGEAPPTVKPEPAKDAAKAAAPKAAPTPPSVLDEVQNAANEAAGHKVDGPVDSADALAKVRAADQVALKAAAEAAALEQTRQAAAAERQELERRRASYVQTAKYHLQYLQLRLKDEDLDRASTHLALLRQSLEGVRSNLSQGVAADEIAFALGAMYDLQTIGVSEDKVTQAGLAHLKRALGALPAAGPAAPASLKPTAGGKGGEDSAALKNSGAPSPDDPASLAKEVTEIVALLEQKQRQTGRDRLQSLVLLLGNDQPRTLVELAETARRQVADAVAAHAFKRAAWGADRLSKLLDELTAAVTPAATKPAAASAPAASGKEEPEHGQSGSGSSGTQG